MKKFVFMLIAALSVALTACSAFDSNPIEPEIIGTGNLQYEAKSGTWFVVVESSKYNVATVTILARNRRSFSKTQNIEPVKGMEVTVFTSPRRTGIQAVAGSQSVEQIEKLYHTNNTGMFMVFFAIILGLIAIAFKAEKK